MSKWLPLLLVAACNFGHNRILEHEIDAPAVPIDAAELQPDAAEHVDANEHLDAAPPAGCELVPQGGCTGSAPACDLTSADDGTVDCRAVTKAGIGDDHCPTDTACAVGYTCTHGSDDAAQEPWCARFCDLDTDCSGIGSRCVIGLVGSAGEALDIDVCSEACDLVGQTGCPSEMACYGFEDGSGDYTDCDYPGTTALGGDCSIDQDCVAGAVCVEHGTKTTCEPVCVVGDDTSCASDETCEGFTVPLNIGSDEYGACL
jgi:hypothetical protein